VVQRTAVSCFVELISDGAIIVKVSLELCLWMTYAFIDGINDGSQNVYIFPFSTLLCHRRFMKR
jgi:hypothetical protein